MLSSMLEEDPLKISIAIHADTLFGFPLGIGIGISTMALMGFRGAHPETSLLAQCILTLHTGLPCRVLASPESRVLVTLKAKVVKVQEGARAKEKAKAKLTAKDPRVAASLAI